VWGPSRTSSPSTVRGRRRLGQRQFHRRRSGERSTFVESCDVVVAEFGGADGYCLFNEWL